jgi:hypothetical protein
MVNGSELHSNFEWAAKLVPLFENIGMGSAGG